MHANEAERTPRLRDFARGHAMRASILALIEEDEDRSLDPDALSRDLPNKPSASLVSYHLKVLKSAFLLPPQAAGGTGSAAP